jgi:hypothetical protein
MTAYDNYCVIATAPVTTYYEASGTTEILGLPESLILLQEYLQRL